MSVNTILYGSGLYNNPKNPSIDASSGFSTVILWSLHVSSTGDLGYNNTALVSDGVVTPLAAKMAPQVAALRSGGVKVFFCVGSADASDFQDVFNLLQTSQGTSTLKKNFGALLAAIPVDGFDFDMEEGEGSDMQDAVVGLTALLSKEFGSEITYCPYQGPQFWVNCLAAVYAKLGSQPVVWFNLQCYAGGSGQQASEWISAIQSSGSPTGVSDPASFVMPGYGAVDGPSGICQDFNGQAVAGGFIWNSSGIYNSGSTPNDYATAIEKGIAGNC